jgi:hypothetical protein
MSWEAIAVMAAAGIYVFAVNAVAWRVQGALLRLVDNERENNRRATTEMIERVLEKQNRNIESMLARLFPDPRSESGPNESEFGVFDDLPVRKGPMGERLGPLAALESEWNENGDDGEEDTPASIRAIGKEQVDRT